MNLSQANPMGFRQWIICEDFKNKLTQTKGDKQFPEMVFAYLSAALDIPAEKTSTLPWDEVVNLIVQAISNSPSIDVPIVKDAPKGAKEVDWDYPGRTFNHYVNVLAGKYGWSIEYIAELDVNQAFALIQEILTDEFLEQEFYYSLSEVAYPYNKSTRKSNYKPMERPYWMKPLASKQPKRIKMRKDTLPMGRVIDISGLPPEFQIDGYVTEKQK